MSSQNSKTSDAHKLSLLNLLDKTNFKASDEYVALSNLSIFYTWKNIKKSYKNNKFRISGPWNEQFELPDESCSVLDIQDYFEYILKKHETVTDNPSIMTYVNKIEYRTTFETKTGYYLELSKPETMKLLRRTKSKITKNENGKNVSHLEITEVILIYCNIFHNDYQQDSRVLYTFIRNKSFGQLLDISSKYSIFLKTFNSEFPYIEVKPQTTKF